MTSIAGSTTVAATSTSRGIMDRLNPRTPGWLWWDSSQESIDSFLSHVRPSQVSASVCSWIAVDNVMPNSPGYDDDTSVMIPDDCGYQAALDKIKTIKETHGRVKKDQKDECIEDILSIARRNNMTMGKWMLWRNSTQCDALWYTIARETSRGTLGCSCKIGPGLGSNSVLCCVYVKDFSDKQEVKRVLLQLQNLGLTIKSGFKPDVFTHLNINSKNMWGLPPTIYSVKEVEES